MNPGSPVRNSTMAQQRCATALVKNVVALGALQGVTQMFPKETFLAAICSALSGKRAMVALNEQAFERGCESTIGSNQAAVVIA